MSITLISSPKKYCPAHWSCAWEFQMSDLGTPPERFDFGCYLAEEGGARLTEDKKIIPFAADTNFKKEFAAVTAGMVNTVFPTESASAQTDSSYVKRVKLKYGQIDFNSDTCETESDLSSETSVLNLINANTRSEFQALFGNSSGFIAPRTGLLLHQRPTRWNLLHGSKDYIWMLGAGQVVLSYYNGASQIGSNIVFNLTGANTAKYICLDYSVHSISTLPTHLNIFYSDGVVETTIRADYHDCQEQDKYMGVLFLEPFGGRSMLATGTPVSIDIERTGTSINLPFDLSQTNHKTGGRSLYFAKGSRKLTFETEINPFGNWELWLEGFASSTEHHLQRGYGANLRWEKFILDPSSINIITRNTIPVFKFSGYSSEYITPQTIGQ